MNQITRKSLQELAEITQLLHQCEIRLAHIPSRFKTIYIALPPSLLKYLHNAQSDIQTLASQLVSFQNISPKCADLSQYLKK